MRIVVDDREVTSGLPEAIRRGWPTTAVGRLAVGDVEVGPRVVIERKTVPDFVASIRDGRLFRQAYAMAGVAWRPLLILEGTEPFAVLGMAPEALRGALLSLTVAFRIPVLRTVDVEETALYVVRIAHHEARRLARRARPPRVRPARQALEVLSAIPGVGDERARRLLDAFGSVDGVSQAEADDLGRVPGIGPATARGIRSAPGPAPEDGR